MRICFVWCCKVKNEEDITMSVKKRKRNHSEHNDGVRELRKKKDFFFICETYTKKINIIIDFLMVDWFQVYCVVFPFKEKNIFHVNLYIFVCDQYFSLVIIIFEDWLKFNWFSEFTLGTEQHNGQSITVKHAQHAPGSSGQLHYVSF